MKNLLKAIIFQLKHEGIFGFFGNSLGIFSKKSHYLHNGTKIQYSEKAAEKAAKAMSKKYNKSFSHYKCVFCDYYHIGKNKHES